MTAAVADVPPNPRKRSTSMKDWFRWLKQAGYDQVDIEISGKAVRIKATGESGADGRKPDPIDEVFGEDDD